ncbi:ATP-binding protein [Candidatus Gottesmanbacteria bacterium]|nr:ATP-binding protein [Candidatus Gottesmanbacteria bacterium]
MIKDRYLHSAIREDLKEKMVFLGGPRQIGKTTLAQFLGKHDYASYEYLNWDNREDRKRILENMFRADAGLIIFDEIHKYKKWKNYIKGEFDIHKDIFHILVTGSARLDLYRRGGDSLMGRYHYYRLHPFSSAEVLGIQPKITVSKELIFPTSSRSTTRVFADLLEFGGFPEPFLKKNQQTLRRFHNERVDRLIREDIRDIEHVRDISALQVLVEILPSKVGSLLSLNTLRGDLEVAHKTVKAWMDILERFYYHFRIYPYAFTTIKSLRKEPKMYLWDWSQVADEGARLENMIACHILKMVHLLYDAYGHKAELYFLRDIEGREVDFLVTVDRKPWLIIETKSSQKDISKALVYFASKLAIPFVYQLVKDSGIDYWKKNIRIMSADKFLSGLV